MASLPPLLLVLLTLTLAPEPAASELILETGYTVSTVLDGNKPLRGSLAGGVHPFAAVPRRRAGDLLLLDNVGSALYSLAAPFSEDPEIRLFSGRGSAGFADGAPTSAMFNQPRSFTVDDGDNVYVADRSNRAIRKIDGSGMTTTIAGGYSVKTGHIDGPAQNASFSNDFDLVYVPKLCSLLISDRGNRLLRQINLKPEDCAHESKLGLGAASVSIVAAMCVLIGSVLGFVVRPYLGHREVSINHLINKIRRHYRSNLGERVLIAFSGIRSAIADSLLFALVIKLVRPSLCHLRIILRNLWVQKQVQSFSLLDSDVNMDDQVLTKSQIFSDPMKDLISFDEDTDASEVSKLCFHQEDNVGGDLDSISGKIDGMIKACLLGFSDSGKQQQQGCGDGLYRRRIHGM